MNPGTKDSDLSSTSRLRPSMNSSFVWIRKNWVNQFKSLKSLAYIHIHVLHIQPNAHMSVNIYVYIYIYMLHITLNGHHFTHGICELANTQITPKWSTMKTPWKHCETTWRPHQLPKNHSGSELLPHLGRRPQATAPRLSRPRRCTRLLPSKPSPLEPKPSLATGVERGSCFFCDPLGSHWEIVLDYVSI